MKRMAILFLCIVVASLVGGCTLTDEEPLPWIEDAALELSPLHGVTGINEPRPKAGFVYSFEARMNLRRLETGDRYNARLTINDPEMREEIGSEVIRFPTEGEFYEIMPNGSNTNLSVNSFPYRTTLSPQELQRKIDFGLLKFEIYQGEKILASKILDRLEVDESYYGESEHWWVSSDMRLEFGETDADPDFFTLSFNYKGTVEELQSMKRLEVTQATAINTQTVTLSESNDPEDACGGILGSRSVHFEACESNHLHVAFHKAPGTLAAFHETVDRYGMSVLIRWTDKDGREHQETVDVNNRELVDNDD